nr:hypothetical protein [Tanacetum cinerariifolium]
MNDIDYHTSARKLVYIQSPLHSNSERPTTAMLPIFPLQQIPNTLIAGIETHTETPFTYKVPVDANWAKTTLAGIEINGPHGKGKGKACLINERRLAMTMSFTSIVQCQPH